MPVVRRADKAQRYLWASHLAGAMPTRPIRRTRHHPAYPRPPLACPACKLLPSTSLGMRAIATFPLSPLPSHRPLLDRTFN